MSEVKNNKGIMAGKAYAFALEIIIVYKQLTSETKANVLSKQLLRSEISIGANVNETISSESKRDLVEKFGIALKEARETPYRLNLLNGTQNISIDTLSKCSQSCSEILRMLSSIILTTKEHYFKPNSSAL